MFQINQSTLHLLLPGKISWLVEYMRDDYGFTLQECLKRIYHSKLYKKLSTESTKYWHLGPVDLYTELKKEIIGKQLQEVYDVTPDVSTRLNLTDKTISVSKILN